MILTTFSIKTNVKLLDLKKRKEKVDINVLITCPIKQRDCPKGTHKMGRREYKIHRGWNIKNKGATSLHHL